MLLVKVRGKAVPVRVLSIPGIQDMKVVSLSAISTAAFTPQVISLVLISVRGGVDLRGTQRPEGLSQ